MTDAQYFSIANGLPKRNLNGIWLVDWRSAIAGCDPNIREACEFVLGFDPIARCWVDPGAQYVNRPNPYPAPSGWGVSICNPPASGGGGSSTGSGGNSGNGQSGGSGSQTPGTQPPAPLPSLNMNYVLISLAVLGVMMFMRK